MPRLHNLAILTVSVAFSGRVRLCREGTPQGIDVVLSNTLEPFLSKRAENIICTGIRLGRDRHINAKDSSPLLPKISSGFRLGGRPSPSNRHATSLAPNKMSRGRPRTISAIRWVIAKDWYSCICQLRRCDDVKSCCVMAEKRFIKAECRRANNCAARKRRFGTQDETCSGQLAKQQPQVFMPVDTESDFVLHVQEFPSAEAELPDPHLIPFVDVIRTAGQPLNIP